METLEEAIDNYVYKTSNEKNLCDIIVKAIKFGAKWQQERSYSEEEVLTILHKRDIYKWEEHQEILSLNQWFELFKNK